MQNRLFAKFSKMLKSRISLNNGRSDDNPSFIIKTKHGEIVIANRHKERVECYIDQLTYIVKEVVSLLELNELIIEQTSILSITSELVNHFASILDKNIILFMDADIKKYRHEQDIDIDTLSTTDAKRLYDLYLKTCVSKKDKNISYQSYGEYLIKKYPHLGELQETMAKNFVMNITTMLKRINVDIDLLRKGLLMELSEPIHLAEIKSTGSDFHMQGNQVYILEFSDLSGHSQKMIYKPTSVISDAMIVGDSERLSQLNPENYANHKSMITIFNESLINSDRAPLPTYLIIPCIDDNSTHSHHDIRRHYGYSEFLTHQPWNQINYNQLLESELTKIKPSMRKYYLNELYSYNDITNDSLREKIIQQSVDLLNSASHESECDFITSDENEGKQYAFDCGVLIILMVTTGLVDGHYGNLIIHQLRPYILDTEACITIAPLEIDNMTCLDSDAGSMSINSICNETSAGGVCLFDITGCYTTPAHHIEKNMLFIKTNDSISPIPLDKTSFMEGIRMGLRIIKDNPEVLKWYEQKAVTTMPIRVIPFNTSHFSNELSQMINREFSITAFEENRESIIMEYKQAYEIECEKYYASNESQPLPVPPPLPYECVYHADLLKEYKTGSIPYFFAFSNATKLYDFDGQCVNLPLEYKEMRAKYAESSTDFFPYPPLQFIRERTVGLSHSNNDEIFISSIIQALEKLDHYIHHAPSDFLNIKINNELAHKLMTK